MTITFSMKNVSVKVGDGEWKSCGSFDGYAEDGVITYHQSISENIKKELDELLLSAFSVAKDESEDA